MKLKSLPHNITLFQERHSMYKRIAFYLFVVIAFTVSAQTIALCEEGSIQADKPLSVAADLGIGRAGCGKNPPDSGQATTIDVDGTARQYILTLPDNYDPKHPYVLIFVPHPMGGNMQGTVRGGYLGLKNVSDNKAIFVAPDGMEKGFWNRGGSDVKFFKAMLERFNSTLCVDQKRIFSTGFSFGGMMSFAVGCAMPDKFRAIAPNSGSFVSGCDTSHPGPIAVIQSHGKSDTVMSIAEGNKARDYFLKMNGCSNETKPIEPTAGNCVEYQGCKEGYPYIYCAFDGGHAPQSWEAPMIWKFFTETLK
jgi:polyhydroxybutyrate depolymerase